MDAGGLEDHEHGNGAFNFPTKRVGSGVLLRDVNGAVLLVKPTYKPGWEIPGGLVEPDESPREAAVRECREELGLVIDVGQLLCVHYSQGGRVPGDGVMFVFDAGSTEREADRFTLPTDELSAAKFVPPSALGAHLPPVMVTRLQAAIAAAQDQQIRYDRLRLASPHRRQRGLHRRRPTLTEHQNLSLRAPQRRPLAFSSR
jgi:8-oxo-dGTP diphosphatase